MEVRVVAPGERPYLEIDFPPAPADRPYVIVNMVGSLDGKAVITETEQGLGSRADKDRMQELRAQCDAVMNGASTLRKSGASSRVRADALVAWRKEQGKREQPLGVLITRRGDFELKGPYFDGSLEAVIFATAMTEARRAEIEATGATVAPIADSSDGLREALRYLRQERGVELLLCEGGPTTNAGLIEVGAFDELFLTLGPLLVGGKGTLTILEGARPAAIEDVTRLEPVSVLANDETGELYLRYRVTERAEA